jgi:hypothetical protein
MIKDVLLATSVAPNADLDRQREALVSWRSQGFQLVSVNSAKEIVALEDGFPETDFIPATNTAEALTGRPLVFVSEILDYLADSSHAIVGLTNADIHLATDPGPLEKVAHIANDSLICGPRFDVENLEDEDGRLDPVGFDYFIFDRSMKRFWHPSRLCLGMPYWDHWLPFAALLSGVPLKILDAPIARHQIHPINWGPETLVFAGEFIRNLIEVSSRHTSDNGMAAAQASYELKTFGLEKKFYQLQYQVQEEGPSTDPTQSEAVTALAAFYDEATKLVAALIRRYATLVTFD